MKLGELLDEVCTEMGWTNPRARELACMAVPGLVEEEVPEEYIDKVREHIRTVAREVDSTDQKQLIQEQVDFISRN